MIDRPVASRRPWPCGPLRRARSRAGAAALLLMLAVAAPLSLAALGCDAARPPAESTTAAETKAPETSDGSIAAEPKLPEAEPAAASPAPTPDAAAEAPPTGAAASGAVEPDPPAAAPAVVDAAPRNISFDKIKFEMKSNADYKPELLTPEIKALDKHNVRIRGFMFPSYKPTGLTEWVLVRDNLQCCFGGNAILYDCIIVDMKPGKSTDYTTRPVAVEGTFTIRDYFDPDGVRRAIYHLDGESVRF